MYICIHIYIYIYIAYWLPIWMMECVNAVVTNGCFFMGCVALWFAWPTLMQSQESAVSGSQSCAGAAALSSDSLQTLYIYIYSYVYIFMYNIIDI